MNAIVEQPPRENSPSDMLERFTKGAQLLGAMSALVYVAGFLCINAYLGTLGVRDFDLLNTQYLTAGALFLILVIDFWFSIGRHARIASEDMKEFIERGPLANVRGLATRWFTGRLYFTTQIFYVTCICVVFYAGLFFGPLSPNSLLAYGQTMTAGFIRFETIRQLDKPNPVRPVLRLILLSILQVVVFGAFVWWGSAMEVRLLFVLLVTAFTFWYVSDKTFSAEKQRTLWRGTVVAGVMVGALYFGSYVYPEINPRLGGGRLLPVELLLDRQISERLHLLTGKEPDPIIRSLKLLTETRDDFIFQRSGSDYTIIRLPKKAVLSIMYSGKEVPRETEDFIETKTNAPRVNARDGSNAPSQPRARSSVPRHGRQKPAERSTAHPPSSSP